MADDEWEDMYVDVIEDLCVTAARIPDGKLTDEMFRRLVKREVAIRESLADEHEDFEDSNRVWAVMLVRISRDPGPHLQDLVERLAGVRAAIAKRGGQRYAAGQDALARREDHLLREELGVDADWNPR